MPDTSIVATVDKCQSLFLSLLLYLTLSRVVMARVAMLRLLSEMRFSRSTLHEVTASGWIMAIRLRVLTAAKRMVGLEEVRNICNTVQMQRRSVMTFAEHGLKYRTP